MVSTTKILIPEFVSIPVIVPIPGLVPAAVTKLMSGVVLVSVTVSMPEIVRAIAKSSNARDTASSFKRAGGKGCARNCKSANAKGTASSFLRVPVANLV